MQMPRDWAHCVLRNFQNEFLGCISYSHQSQQFFRVQHTQNVSNKDKSISGWFVIVLRCSFSVLWTLHLNLPYFLSWNAFWSSEHWRVTTIVKFHLGQYKLWTVIRFPWLWLNWVAFPVCFLRMYFSFSRSHNNFA